MLTVSEALRIRSRKRTEGIGKSVIRAARAVGVVLVVAALASAQTKTNTVRRPVGGIGASFAAQTPTGWVYASVAPFVEANGNTAYWVYYGLYDNGLAQWGDGIAPSSVVDRTGNVVSVSISDLTALQGGNNYAYVCADGQCVEVSPRSAALVGNWKSYDGAFSSAYSRAGETSSTSWYPPVLYTSLVSGRADSFSANFVGVMAGFDISEPSFAYNGWISIARENLVERTSVTIKR